MSDADILKKYFDREWLRFQSDAQQFAKQYPEQAGRLQLDAAHARDPNVDHLLQGCTFLAAQIHRRIEEEADAFPIQLTMQLWPEMIQPVPSMSVGVFTLKAMTAQTCHVPAGTAMASLPVGDEKTVCRFVTTDPLSVSPFVLTSIATDPTKRTMTLRFQSQFQRNFPLHALSEVSFFLSGDYLAATELYYHLQHIQQIDLHCMGEEFKASLTLAFEYVPSNSSSLLAHQVLFDFFSFHQRFMMGKLSGFHQIPTRIAATEFSLTFLMTTPMRDDYRVAADEIVLNTVPIENRFKADCEPIHDDDTQYAYPLVPDRGVNESLELIAVTDVQGLSVSTGKLTHYIPYYQCDDQAVPSYALSLSLDAAQAPTFQLSCFHHPSKPCILSVTAAMCNGYYPKRYVQKNTMTLADPGLAHRFTATNILAPTKPLYPPKARLSQILMRYLSLNLTRLLQKDTLKKLMQELNWSSDPALQRRIDGIMDVSLRTATQISRGGFHHVHEVCVQLNQSHFSSSHDVYFFGSILYEFFSAHSMVTHKVSLRVKTYPHEEVFEWVPRSGQSNMF